MARLESKDVEKALCAALSIACYYGIKDELALSIENSYEKLVREGYIAR